MSMFGPHYIQVLISVLGFVLTQFPTKKFEVLTSFYEKLLISEPRTGCGKHL